jgi:hypothetical protein
VSAAEGEGRRVGAVADVFGGAEALVVGVAVAGAAPVLSAAEGAALSSVLSACFVRSVFFEGEADGVAEELGERDPSGPWERPVPRLAEADDVPRSAGAVVEPP